MAIHDPRQLSTSSSTETLTSSVVPKSVNLPSSSVAVESRSESQSQSTSQSQGESQLQPSASHVNVQRPVSHDDGQINTSFSPSTSSQYLQLPPHSSAMSRRSSAGSDTLSVASSLSTQLPERLVDAPPPPAYIAPFGITQVLSDSSRINGGRGSDEKDDASSIGVVGDVHFSKAALATLNAFLDQLLFSFLHHSQSTSLSALRPAVTSVLRTDLATDAIASAEAELHELLAGNEDEEEEMNARQTKAETARKWDLELVWKRTRLRVMVYTRLGAIEDEDEERYVREEEALIERRFSQSTGLVSWAAAIFLTTVLEHVAEQTIRTAARIARTRVKRASRDLAAANGMDPVVSPSDGVTVEEHDMEKIALDATLGRLWRAWRKSLRHLRDESPLALNGAALKGQVSNPEHSPSATSFGTAYEMDESRSRRVSTAMSATGAEGDAEHLSTEQIPDAQYPEHVLAANIPLPMSDSKRDIDEIEVPGLARDPDEESDGFRTPNEYTFQHRRSMSDLKLLQTRPTTLTRQRSNSVPTRQERAAAKERSDHALKAGVEDAFAEADDKDSDVTETAPERDATDHEAEKPAEHAGIVAGAVAGASAIAAAAVSLVLGSREKDKDQKEKGNVEESEDEALSTKKDADAHDRDTAAVPDVVDVPKDAVTSEPVAQVEEHEPGTSSATESQDLAPIAGASTHESASVSAAEAKDVVPSAEPPTKEPAVALSEEVKSIEASAPSHDDTPAHDPDAVDTQKYLIDMKHMNGITVVKPARSATPDAVSRPNDIEPEDTTTTKIAPAAAEPVAEAEVPSRPGSTASQQSFTLFPRTNGPDAFRRSVNSEISQPSTQEPAANEAMHTVVAQPRTEEQMAEDAMLMKYTSTANPRRFSRLILGMDDIAPSSQPDSLRAAPVEQEAFPRRSVSPVSEQVEQPVASLKQNRLSAPLSGEFAQQQQQTPDKATYRQSMSASYDRNGSALVGGRNAGQTVEGFGRGVHDHPVIQRIAGLKNNGAKSSLDGESLTSASIRGPADFDSLLQGADTVKYTLTPENVRDGAVVRTAERVYPDDRLDQQQSPSERVKNARDSARTTSREGVDGRLGRSQSMKQTTSTKTDEYDDARRKRSSVQSKADNRRSISRPPTRNTSTHRRSGLMAREPQVQTESTLDFADFIRSTGPDKALPPPPPIPASPVVPATNRSTVSLNSSRRKSWLGRTFSRSSSPGARSMRSMSRIPMRDDDAPPVPPLSRPKSTMTPRDAKSGKENSSDLIDFIRRGPLRRKSKKEREIAQSVAPFRDTMDSDRMPDWTEAQEAERHRSWGRSVTAISRSSLLQSSNNIDEPVHPAHSGQPQSLNTGPPRVSSLPPRSVNSVRRSDPYDLSSFEFEDEDDITALPGPRREEQSLVEFLRSTAPEDSHRGGMNGHSTTTALPSRTNSFAGSRATSSHSSAPRAALPSHLAGRSSAGVPRTYAPTKMEARPPSGRLDRDYSSTRELSDFLRTSGPELPPSTGFSINRTASAPDTPPLPPPSTSSRHSRNVKGSKSMTTGAAAAAAAAAAASRSPVLSSTATGSTEGKRRWWAIFSSKNRNARRSGLVE